MKIKSILVSMLAVAALASCSKEDGAAGTTPDAKGDNAFLSVALNAASATPGTFAESGPKDENGTSDESKVSGDVIVVGFAADKNSVLGVYTLSPTEKGTIGYNDVAAAAGDAFQVSKDLKYIFVVVNPTDEIKKQINASTTTYAGMNQVITEEVGKLTVAEKFLMTSAGEYSTSATDTYKQQFGLVEVAPTLAASESADDIAAAKATAKGASYAVKVDRAVAKVAVTKSATMSVVNGTASIDNWKANTTNKKYLPYAELVDYVVPAGKTMSKYRKDVNYATAVITDFNWLDNKTVVDWNDIADAEYVHENTMDAASQAYGNTTKVIIKAKFAPTGVTLGDSWFRVGGIIKTFAQLQDDYTKAKAAVGEAGYVAGTNKNAESIITGYDAFAAAVLGTGKTFDDATLTLVDAVANGGYQAVKARPYMIEYFQKSVCYYDVNLKHDNRVEAKLLGRWGVVRNNFYTLTITKISKAGKPFIPDPVDPEIPDPEKPDPDEPDDETSAYISVTINVNPWTAWVQETEL